MRKFFIILMGMLFTLLFTACKQFTADIDDYLSYWSAEAFVTGHSIGPAHRPDGAGMQCVGSSADALITLTAHNPKNLTLSKPAGIVEFKKLSQQPVAGTDYELKQTGSGTLELTYKQAFLQKYEQGSADLSPTITLKAQDGRVFKQTYTFSIKSNSPPPKPEVVLAKTNDSPSHYVLCLKFNSAEMTKTVTIGSASVPVHKDIANITINDTSYALLYKDDNSDFKKPAETNPIGSFIGSGEVAQLTETIPPPPGVWVLYFKTDIGVESINTQTSYTITLRDKEGVVSDSVTAELKEKFKVEFDAKDGSAVPSQYIENGGKVTKPSPEPAKTGFTFGGWYKDPDCSDGQEWDFGNHTVTSGITLYAKWNAGSGTQYKVEHYQQNIDGTYPTTATATDPGLTGTTNDPLSVGNGITLKDYAGFERDYIDPADPKIGADGNTVVKVYYKRKPYDVSFSVVGNVGGSIAVTAVTGGSVTSTSPVTVKYGGSVTFTASSDPGWEVDSWTVATANTPNTTASLTVTGNATVTVKFKLSVFNLAGGSGAWKRLREEAAKTAGAHTIIINGEITATGGDDKGEIKPGRDLTIKKADSATSAVLDADNLSRIFHVQDGKTLTLENIELKNGKAAGTDPADENGGGVSVTNGGKLTLKNTTITGCQASYGGAVYVNGSSSSVTMQSGSLTANTALYIGGAVSMEGDSASFTMTGGKITGNTGRQGGGGVYVNSGTFTLGTGASIESNTAEGNDGGGVCVEPNGTLNINGGSIKSNKATKTIEAGNGGGVYVFGRASGKGKVIMTAGEISGNTAGFNGTTYDGGGGGVYNKGGEFTMTGGEIKDNSAKDGGGVYVKGTTATLTMKGSAIVTPSTGSDADKPGKNDVYLEDSAKITVDGTLSNNPVARITPQSYMERVVLEAGSGVTLANEVGKFTVTPPNPPMPWYIDSSGTLKAPATATAADGNQLRDAIQSAQVGKPLVITITQDFSTTESFKIPNGKNITIKDDGTRRTLNCPHKGDKHKFFLVEDGGKLTLQGKITLKGVDNGNDEQYALYVEKGGTAEIKDNVTITDFKNNGEACVYTKGTLIMSGGKIKGNRARFGGGVFIFDDGIFEMTGGSIEYNSVVSDGSAIRIRGVFNWRGGTIQNNTINNPGPGRGALYIDGPGKLNNTSGNTAS